MSDEANTKRRTTFVPRSNVVSPPFTFSQDPSAAGTVLCCVDRNRIKAMINAMSLSRGMLVLNREDFLDMDERMEGFVSMGWPGGRFGGVGVKICRDLTVPG